jgi:hypothetical protein
MKGKKQLTEQEVRLLYLAKESPTTIQKLNPIFLETKKQLFMKTGSVNS